jgi:hypothetical protein
MNLKLYPRKDLVASNKSRTKPVECRSKSNSLDLRMKMLNISADTLEYEDQWHIAIA